jgi:hypothetical protein
MLFQLKQCIILSEMGEFKLQWLKKCKIRLCGLVAKVTGYETEMYCVSCEVRTEFIYVM